MGVVAISELSTVKQSYSEVSAEEGEKLILLKEEVEF